MSFLAPHAIDDMIATYGWMIQYVSGSDTQPSFTYTVGLTAKGLPELVVFSMQAKMARFTLNQMARRLVSGEAVPIDVRLADTFDGGDAQLVHADRDLADKYMHQARYRYPDYHALQLVWTDPGMHFPWEEGYADKFIALQPVLRHRRN